MDISDAGDNPPTKIRKTILVSHSHSPSSSDEEDTLFPFEEKCFFCQKTWSKKDGSVVANWPCTRERVIKACAERDNEHAKVLSALLESSPADNSVGARYHKICQSQFFRSSGSKQRSVGRAKNVELHTSFLNLCTYIEQNSELIFNLSELTEKFMSDYVPHAGTLFDMLSEKYGDKLLIFRCQKREPLICFRNTVMQKLITDKEKSEAPRIADDVKKMQTLDDASKIIRDEIEQFPYDNSCYESAFYLSDNIENKIPNYLNFFLLKLLQSKKKKRSSSVVSSETEDMFSNIPTSNTTNITCKKAMIAHSIIAVIRPGTFQSPLHLALGTYVYRKTASKNLINILSSLGVCTSYYSTQLYEASVVMNSKTKISPEGFIQFSFDNADHNISTIDGHNTWHCMGGICCVTPRDSVVTEERILKLKKMPSAAELSQRSYIKIQTYEGMNKDGLEKITYRSITSGDIAEICNLPIVYSAYLWLKSLRIKNVPTWRTFMEKMSIGSRFAVSRVIFLPFINHSPSNLSTIYTSILTALQQCEDLGKLLCIVTFDQPLYQKARAIAVDLQLKRKEKIIIRLGGFHLIMSYMGAVANIMKGSGLEDLWSIIYATNSLKKMLTGHAYSRALRAHILTWTAIGMLIVDDIDDSSNERIKKEFTDLWEDNSYAGFNLSSCSHNIRTKVTYNLFKTKFKSFNKNNGPTAKLWLQYFDFISVLLQFIQAERLGDWKLHLSSLKKMIPVFHAGGHFPYAKSAYLYFQDMQEFTDDYVENYADEKHNFIEDGYFTICRSDKNWCGVSSDQTIEQTVMRDTKDSRGGLTHGRGVTTSAQSRFVLGKIVAIDMIESLEEYCSSFFTSSEQHVESQITLQKRDDEDIDKLYLWLKQHNPFQCRDELMSLSTGIVGAKGTNCHEAMAVGIKSMENMVGKNARDVKLTSASKVRSLAMTKCGVKLNKEQVVTIDPSLLFQRFSILIQNKEEAHSAFDFELAPYPMSMFDDNGRMRKSQKSILYNQFKKRASSDILQTSKYVIDGGFLLHRVVWPDGQPFEVICNSYVNYVQNHYNINATIVFDGYNDDIKGTKSYERYQRSSNKLCPDIIFDSNTIPTTSQSTFLSNTNNKRSFVNLLRTYLEQRGHAVFQAQEDADRLIVTTAIDFLSTTTAVVVVGNDIDLLLLCIALTPNDKTLYYLTVTNKSNVLYSSSDYSSEMSSWVLFAHAFAGCDTTCTFYGKGKNTLFTLFKGRKDLQELIQPFNNLYSDPKLLFSIAKKIIIIWYSDKTPIPKKSTTSKMHDDENISLGTIRYNRFKEGLKKKNKVRLERLPPTEQALHFHALRVYYQIQSWYGTVLNPFDWGWEETIRMLMPIMTTDPPAPEQLLKLIYCGCDKSNCGGKCSCRSAGLKCSEMCTVCIGKDCSNAKPEEKIEVLNDNEEYDDVVSNIRERCLEENENNETEVETDGNYAVENLINMWSSDEEY